MDAGRPNRGTAAQRTSGPYPGRHHIAPFAQPMRLLSQDDPNARRRLIYDGLISIGGGVRRVRAGTVSLSARSALTMVVHTDSPSVFAAAVVGLCPRAEDDLRTFNHITLHPCRGFLCDGLDSASSSPHERLDDFVTELDGTGGATDTESAAQHLCPYARAERYRPRYHRGLSVRHTLPSCSRQGWLGWPCSSLGSVLLICPGLPRGVVRILRPRGNSILSFQSTLAALLAPLAPRVTHAVFSGFDVAGSIAFPLSHLRMSTIARCWRPLATLPFR
jgi:hypothetical protein